MSERHRIRAIIKATLRRFKLPHRCTRLKLMDDLRIDDRPVWGWSQITSAGTFMIGIKAGLEEPQLSKVVAHEVAHVPLGELIACVRAGDERQAMLWEERIADLIAELATQ